jgi:hypothetical protein
MKTSPIKQWKNKINISELRIESIVQIEYKGYLAADIILSVVSYMLTPDLCCSALRGRQRLLNPTSLTIQPTWNTVTYSRLPYAGAYKSWAL